MLHFFFPVKQLIAATFRSGPVTTMECRRLLYRHYGRIYTSEIDINYIMKNKIDS
jgi:hypothetical protein